MAPTIVTLGLDAMRTRFEFVLASGEGGLGESGLREAGESAMQEVEEAEARLSLFRRDSLLSHLNRTAAREAVRVDGDTLALLRMCREVWALSEGAFDPTVGPRMTELGLHEGAAIPAGARMVEGGFGCVEIDEGVGAVRFGAAVALDLGAIAKGHALDLAGRVLREAGVACALLHGGTSSVLAIGAPPGEAVWRVAIGASGGSARRERSAVERSDCTPSVSLAEPRLTPPPHAGEGERSAGRGVSVVALRDGALGVSAHHGRSVEAAGGVVTHVLDPRTGFPASAPVRVAAVTARTAALADAWSTAALVLGERPRGMPVDMGCVLI